MCYVLPYNQILVPWPVSRMLERDFLRSCGTKSEEVDYAARDVLVRELHLFDLPPFSEVVVRCYNLHIFPFTQKMILWI